MHAGRALQPVVCLSPCLFISSRQNHSDSKGDSSNASMRFVSCDEGSRSIWPASHPPAILDVGGRRRTVGVRPWTKEFFAYTPIGPGDVLNLDSFQWCASTGVWRKVDSEPPLVPPPASLKVLQLNIWEDQFETGGLRNGVPVVKGSPTHVDTRMQIIADLIETEKPDLIALQEVTAPLALMLLSHESLRGYYCTSWDHIPTHPFCPSGCMLLSKWPLHEPKLHALPSSDAGRNLVSATVRWKSSKGVKEQLTFGTFHFDTQPGDKEIRAAEAKFIGALCTGRSLVCGDTNVKGDPEPLPFGPQFVDAWLKLHPQEAGFTRGPDIIPANIPNNWTSKHNGRMDRIYTRGDLDVEDCRIVGLEGRDLENGERVWASDHAGLFATYRVQAIGGNN